MKHLFLYGGIALVAYSMWKKNQSSGIGTTGLTPATGISVSPATLVVPGATSQGCNTCDQVSGLGGDARITATPSQDSPSSVTHAVERMDFDTINPFMASAA